MTGGRLCWTGTLLFITDRQQTQRTSLPSSSDLEPSLTVTAQAFIPDPVETP